MSQFNSKEFLKELSEELVTNFEKASRATTPGLTGSAREHEVRKKLENALPAGVGVGTGCVIDYLGNASVPSRRCVSKVFVAFQGSSPPWQSR